MVFEVDAKGERTTHWANGMSNDFRYDVVATMHQDRKACSLERAYTSRTGKRTHSGYTSLPSYVVGSQ